MSLSPEDNVDTTLELKRKLENDFIDLENEKMKVFLRIRPLFPAEISQGDEQCLSIVGSSAVISKAPMDSIKFKNCARDDRKLNHKWTFTEVFGPETGQLSFFETTMKNTVKDFIDGQNELLFAYGMTGSGKTYTIQGGLEEPGVIPLTLQLLFQSIKDKQVHGAVFKPQKYCDIIRLNSMEQKEEQSIKDKLLALNEQEDFVNTRNLTALQCKNFSTISASSIFSEDSLSLRKSSTLSSKEHLALEASLRLTSLGRTSVNMQGKVLFTVWVSFMEVYNEYIYDLLGPVPTNSRPKLKLREDKNGNIFVKGLKELCVSTEEDALKLLCLGRKHLQIASTKLNHQSSRSHCIFTIKLIRVLDQNNPSMARVNRLSFCDLAGSERSVKTQNSGIRLKEASNINTSLMVLGRCIDALRHNQSQKEKKIVPFRESKLTRLFTGFFSGKGKASMIINVSPSSHMFDETLAVLKFAAIAKEVATSDCPKIPEESFVMQEINRLTEAWSRSSRRWSSFCKGQPLQKASIDTECDVSLDEDTNNSSLTANEEKDCLIEELLQLVKKLEAELKKHVQEKAIMEAEIRRKVCQEFSEQFVQIENSYVEQVHKIQENAETLMEKRINTMNKALREAYRISHSDEDEGDCSGSDLSDEDDTTQDIPKNEENQLCESPKKSSVPLTQETEKQDKSEEKTSQNHATVQELQEIIYDKERQLQEQEKIIEKSGDILISKDAEIDKLQEKVSELQNIISSKEISSKELKLELKALKDALKSSNDEMKNKDVVIEQFSNLKDTEDVENANFQIIEVSSANEKNLLISELKELKNKLIVKNAEYEKINGVTENFMKHIIELFKNSSSELNINPGTQDLLLLIPLLESVNKDSELIKYNYEQLEMQLQEKNVLIAELQNDTKEKSCLFDYEKLILLLQRVECAAMENIARINSSVGKMQFKVDGSEMRNKEKAVTCNQISKTLKEKEVAFLKLNKEYIEDKKYLENLAVLIPLLQKIEYVATENITSREEKCRMLTKKLNNLRSELDTLGKEAEKQAEEFINREQALKLKESFMLEKEKENNENKEYLTSLETLVLLLQKTEYIATKHIKDSEGKCKMMAIKSDKLKSEFCKEIGEKVKAYNNVQQTLQEKSIELAAVVTSMKHLQKQTKIQLMEEREQHSVEIEQTMSLKRQIETDYRSLRKKMKVEEENTKDRKQMQKTERPKRQTRASKKQLSAEEDKDFEPVVKRTGLRKKKVQFQEEEEEENIVPNAYVGSTFINMPTSPLHKLQEYVAGKSPSLKSVAQRVITFLSPSNEQGNVKKTSNIGRRKKLFSNTTAAPLICSPVPDEKKIISPKKIVSKQLRRRKDK